VKVGTYHRVSTLDQNPELAREELRAAAARMGGGAVALEVEETGSGAKADRPGLARIMDAARAGKIDVVAVWKLDRFGRSALDLLGNVRELRRLGVRFVATTQGIEIGDESSAAGKLLLTMLAGVAEFERELIVERTQMGLAHARKHGTKSGKPIGVPPANIAPDARARALQLREELRHGYGLGRPGSWREVRRRLIAERLLLPYPDGKRAGKYPTHAALVRACSVCTEPPPRSAARAPRKSGASS
jgi:putative DNA-invertase from lambdoid prophage Rac